MVGLVFHLPTVIRPIASKTAKASISGSCLSTLPPKKKCPVPRSRMSAHRQPNARWDSNGVVVRFWLSCARNRTNRNISYVSRLYLLLSCSCPIKMMPLLTLHKFRCPNKAKQPRHSYRDALRHLCVVVYDELVPLIYPVRFLRLDYDL